MWSRCFTSLAVLIGLAACSAADVLNAAAPHRGVATTRDVPYGEGPRRKLDVYAPSENTNAPVVVFFYGGGWTTGQRGMYRFVGAAMASRGVVVMVPDYRLYPEVKFPGYVQD